MLNRPTFWGHITSAAGLFFIASQKAQIQDFHYICSLHGTVIERTAHRMGGRVQQS